MFNRSELNDIRRLFPHTANGLVYLNHAAISPLPKPVYDAVKNSFDVRHTGLIENFEEGEKLVSEARTQISGYINAQSPEQITFMGNTSDAISAVAEGLHWSEGDEIILNTLEFPSNVQPFRWLEKRGVILRYHQAKNHRFTPRDLEEMITPATRLLSVSAVQYLGGFSADLEAIGKICRDRDILFIVDGIQALGATPIDVQRCSIDALATGGHKWLMAPMGSGFLYLSKKLQSTLEPAKTGWLSVADPWDLSNFDQPWLPVSSHLETGTPNFSGITGLGASIKLFREFGPERIKNQITGLSTLLVDLIKKREECRLITPSGESERLGIVTFAVDVTTDHNEIIQALKKKNITISAREGYFRFSPHFYNTEQEVRLSLNQLFEII